MLVKSVVDNAVILDFDSLFSLRFIYCGEDLLLAINSMLKVQL